MAHRFGDRVKETSTTTGTGTLTVAGAVTAKFQALSAILTTNGDTAWGLIEHQSADEWEVCLLTRVTSTTYSRSSTLSSSTGSAVSFSAGTKHVMIVAPASKTIVQDANGAVWIQQASGTGIYFGNNASDNGSDELASWYNQANLNGALYSIGDGGVNAFAPGGAITAPSGIQSCLDRWGWVGVNTACTEAALTFSEHRGGTFQVSAFADNAKTANITMMSGLKISEPTITETGTGVVNVTECYGGEVQNQSPAGATTWGAWLIANNNATYYRNVAGSGRKVMFNLDTSDNVILGDASVAMLLNGAVILSIGPFGLTDGVAEPSAIGGFSQQYVDTADGILKIKHGDGEVVVLQFGHGDAIALAGGYALP